MILLLIAEQVVFGPGFQRQPVSKAFLSHELSVENIVLIPDIISVDPNLIDVVR